MQQDKNIVCFFVVVNVEGTIKSIGAWLLYTGVDHVLVVELDVFSFGVV